MEKFFNENPNEKERLKNLRMVIDKEILRVRELVASKESVDSEDFDLRGELYRLAFEVAPVARKQDLINMEEWIKPVGGEKLIDIAAGTGFLTIPLGKWTKDKIYAIDPSSVQLSNLEKKANDLNIETIVGSFSENDVLERIGEDIENIDLVTSYGGLHHVLDKDGINKQKELFKNVFKVLKPGGRFVAGDVGANTDLARHFEGSVKKNCLTSHSEKWLSQERLEGELIEDTDLKYVRSEILPIKWIFDSEEQLALFMKCLHAYDMTDDEILNDLNSFLGYKKESSGKCILNWPMLFFELKKEK